MKNDFFSPEMSPNLSYPKSSVSLEKIQEYSWLSQLIKQLVMLMFFFVFAFYNASESPHKGSDIALNSLQEALRRS